MSELKYQDSTRIEVDTQYGSVTLSFIGDGCVYIDTLVNAARDPDLSLQVNNIYVSASAHVYRWTDNSWHVGPEFKDDEIATEWWRFGFLHASRPGRYGRAAEVSTSARKKLAIEFENVISKYARDFPATVRNGDRRAINNKIVTLDDKIDTAEKELSTLRFERAGLAVELGVGARVD